MQDGCKVYIDSYMASKEWCFKVIWITFKNHLVESSLTTKTKRPWHSEIPQPFIHYILSCVRTPHMNIISIEIAFGWRLSHIWLHSTLEGPWFHYIHDFGGVLGQPLDHVLLGCHNFMVTALGSCVSGGPLFPFWFRLFYLSLFLFFAFSGPGIPWARRSWRHLRRPRERVRVTWRGASGSGAWRGWGARLLRAGIPRRYIY